MEIGLRCYLVMGRHYSGDNVYYISGVGSVFVQPAYPPDVQPNPSCIGFIDRKPNRQCYSIYYNGFYFVFPSFVLPRSTTNTNSISNDLLYNQIQLKYADPVYVSRILLEKKKIANTIIDVENKIIQIDDIVKIDTIKKFIESIDLKASGKSSIFNFKKRKPSRRNMQHKSQIQNDNFPEGDFLID